MKAETSIYSEECREHLGCAALASAEQPLGVMLGNTRKWGNEIQLFSSKTCIVDKF